MPGVPSAYRKTEQDYQRLVRVLDAFVDEVGEDETHPLASLMEVVGALIERYEDEYVPELMDVEEIKTAITQLSPQALGELRAWYEQFDSQEWDSQIEADVEAGRLDNLAEVAIRSFRAGDYTEV